MFAPNPFHAAVCRTDCTLLGGVVKVLIMEKGEVSSRTPVAGRFVSCPQQRIIGKTFSKEGLGPWMYSLSL